MAAPKPSRLRVFFQSPAGRALLIALTLLILLGAEIVYSLLAIPAFLIFGLALPIWLGIKRPRYLALSGLVVILLLAPLVALVYTQEIQTPISPADSLTTIPGTDGNALLQNASVTPYTGTASTNFTWQVTVVPAGIPKGNASHPLWLNLYISTCPGATSASPPSWCSAGYPFTLLNCTFPPAGSPPATSSQDCTFSHPISGNLSAPVTATFHYTIGSNGIWDWQMGVYTQNATTGVPFFQTLVGDPTYNGLEGPVVGGFIATYFAVLPTIYVFEDLLPLGASFYLILLLYMLFKNRERRRKDAAARTAGPLPPSGTPPTTAGGGVPPRSTSRAPPPPAPPAATEKTCPNCQAVVYENEATCWKCGASLRGSASAPLPSSPPSG